MPIKSLWSIGLLNAVEPFCILEKNFPLGTFREISPFEKLGNVSSEFAGLALMREVGRVHDEVLAHLTDDRIEDLLVGLASDVDVGRSRLDPLHDGPDG